MCTTDRGRILTSWSSPSSHLLLLPRLQVRVQSYPEHTGVVRVTFHLCYILICGLSEKEIVIIHKQCGSYRQHEALTFLACNDSLS